MLDEFNWFTRFFTYSSIQVKFISSFSLWISSFKNTLSPKPLSEKDVIDANFQFKSSRLYGKWGCAFVHSENVVWTAWYIIGQCDEHLFEGICLFFLDQNNEKC